MCEPFDGVDDTGQWILGIGIRPVGVDPIGAGGMRGGQLLGLVHDVTTGVVWFVAGTIDAAGAREPGFGWGLGWGLGVLLVSGFV